MLRVLKYLAFLCSDTGRLRLARAPINSLLLRYKFQCEYFLELKQMAVSIPAGDSDRSDRLLVIGARIDPAQYAAQF